MKKIEKTFPKIIAHRGARREAPENTIPAFERALAYGCDGIEFDVLLTKDNVPVVTHNDDLSILTHFDGFAHSTPFSIIKSLDFGSHFRLSCSDIRIPTLTEVFELLLPHDIKIICEIKAQPGIRFNSVELISGIASDFRFRQPLTISSSDLRVLHNLEMIAPGINRALIIRKRDFSFLRAYFFAKFLKVKEIHAEVSVLNSSLMGKARREGWGISSWTVNTLEDLKRSTEFGVDSIITDDPETVMEYGK